MHSSKANQSASEGRKAVLNFVVTVLLMHFAVEVSGRAASLRGVITANGVGGECLANVEVSGVPPGNGTLSDSDGSFLLKFDKEPGDVVLIRVTKPGYEVINHFELTRELPRDPDIRPVSIYICERDQREEMARRFYQLASTEAIEAKYKQERARREATAAELAHALKDRDLALQTAEQIAKELAKVKPEDSSILYQQAMQLFVQGKVEEALILLDDAKLLQAAQAAQRQVQQVVENYFLKARILTTQFRFEEAENIYQLAVRAAPENFQAAFALASFSLELNHYEKATVTMM